MFLKAPLLCALAFGLTATTANADSIAAQRGNQPEQEFDIVTANVSRAADALVFSIGVSGAAGSSKPTATGKLEGAGVASYVWPTTLDTSVVGFEAHQGILALAVTAHPDFDDTPLTDENGDGDAKNDGGVWHSHWVVLGPDDTCGKGALKVIDIPDGAKPKLPTRWPGLPLLIDSPDWMPSFDGATVSVSVPQASLGDLSALKYDGVTAGLRVSEHMHAPLLCVTTVHDIASGNLSLPGTLTE